MNTPEGFLEALSQQLNDLLGQGKQTGDELRANVRALIQSQMAKLDVVSRDDFDAQQRVLEKTRSQLNQLEQKLATLEQQLTENAKDR